MSDPVAFATARLDEDEQSAKSLVTEGATGMGALIRIFTDGSAAQAIARRVLREVEAGRRILERHQPKPDGTCSWCLEERLAYPEEWQRMAWPCPEFRDLLVRWADHPDYDQEWKP